MQQEQNPYFLKQLQESKDRILADRENTVLAWRGMNVAESICQHYLKTGKIKKSTLSKAPVPVNHVKSTYYESGLIGL